MWGVVRTVTTSVAFGRSSSYIWDGGFNYHVQYGLEPVGPFDGNAIDVAFPLII